MSGARAAIRRLRTGVVPAWELPRLSIGYSTVASQVKASLNALLRDHECPPLFVLGEWGTGKSHLLSYVRQAALSDGFAHSGVSLNARSAPLNLPQRFYPSIAANMTIGANAGLRTILARRLAVPADRAVLIRHLGDVDAYEIQAAVTTLAAAYERDDYLSGASDDAWFTLSGGDLAWADYSYKREQALVRMGGIARLLKAITGRGLVLVFDETETIDQLWNIRSRLAAWDVLGSLTNIEGLWCVFGVTDRFVRTVHSDAVRISNGEITATRSANGFLNAWRSGNVQIIAPPKIEPASANELAQRIGDIYHEAFGVRPERKILVDCVVTWSENPLRNPRRLIRSIIDSLDASRRLDVRGVGAIPH